MWGRGGGGYSECHSIYHAWLASLLSKKSGLQVEAVGVLFWMPTDGRQAEERGGGGRAGGLTVRSTAFTLRSWPRVLRLSTFANSSSISLPLLGRSGIPEDSFSRAVRTSTRMVLPSLASASRAAAGVMSPLYPRKVPNSVPQECGALQCGRIIPCLCLSWVARPVASLIL